MRETKSTTIGDTEYKVTQLGATRGRQVFTRLAKVVGQGATAANPIAGIMSALSVEDVDYLCETLAPLTTVRIVENGKTREPQLSSIFEEWFAGKYMEMVKWLGFALEVNFGSFLKDAGLTLDAGKVQAAIASKSTLVAQTGESGASSQSSGAP